MGFWKGLDNALAGIAVGPGGIAKMRDMSAERAQAAQQREQVQGILGGIQDPMLKMGLLLNPKGTLDALAKGYEPQKLSGGDMLIPGMNGAPGPSGAAQPPRPVYNPRTGIDGGIPYSIGQTGTATYGHGRPASIAETETTTHNTVAEVQRDAEMNAQIEQFAKTYGLNADRLKEEVRNHKATEGIQAGREKRLGAGVGAGGGGSGASPPPGFVLE